MEMPLPGQEAAKLQGMRGSIALIGEASETHPERLSMWLKVTQGKGGAPLISVSFSVNRHKNSFFRGDG